MFNKLNLFFLGRRRNGEHQNSRIKMRVKEREKENTTVTGIVITEERKDMTRTKGITVLIEREVPTDHVILIGINRINPLPLP